MNRKIISDSKEFTEKNTKQIYNRSELVKPLENSKNMLKELINKYK